MLHLLALSTNVNKSIGVFGMSEKKYIYNFGGSQSEAAQMDAKERKNLLGGKGAGLVEMSSFGLPVPAGFTITTEVCVIYMKEGGKYPEPVKQQVAEGLKKVEAFMGRQFGNPENPLLVSVRSGARQSMPGMMETILNVGLTTQTIPGMIQKTNNERFVYDAYRRLLMMYSDVVMEKAAGIEPAEGHGIREQLEKIMSQMKHDKHCKLDTDLQVADLKKLCELFKGKIREVIGKDFPDDVHEQLWGAIGAVFQSWNGKRAISYRRIENIPDDWGTAVNVQSMVFGNMGEHSATGVAFTRNPGTGENVMYGEWLINAQGEDVVAGIRTPYAINKACRSIANETMPTMEELLPTTYKQLLDIRQRLETSYKDMQDIEFTIQDGNLYMLQTRTGKRNGPAAVKIAIDMVHEKMIDKTTAVSRVKPAQIDELLHPMVDPAAELKVKPLAVGLPAGPGGAVGKIVLTAHKAHAMVKANSKEKVILVRTETSPEDVDGMHVSQGILTAKGGMSSHAALIARGWGKCCVVGCSALSIDIEKGTVTIDQTSKDGKALEKIVVHEGDTLTLNGTKGNVYQGAIELKEMDPEKNEDFKTFMSWCDEIRKLGVRTNADTPKDAQVARKFGAQGIGLCRTEHMFFQKERILAMRKMIMAETKEAREEAVWSLLKFQKEDFIGIFQAMEGLPVTIRLLDPPLHEFIPQESEMAKFASDVGTTVDKVKARAEQLHELNPMLGHRGCRLGIVYPEITRMQARAILEAVAELTQKGVKVLCEIMVPIVGHVKELIHQKKLILEEAEIVKKQYGIQKLDFMIGTMIEVPRAAITSDKIAAEAEFFSFGTNDLTQMGSGFSRDDAGAFLPVYVELGIYAKDPFASIDTEGIGELMRMTVEKGRSVKPNLKIGICGEQGGDPDSVAFCHLINMNYVSCSPFRVPIARLAAAHAQIANPRK